MDSYVYTDSPAGGGVTTFTLFLHHLHNVVIGFITVPLDGRYNITSLPPASRADTVVFRLFEINTPESVVP